MADQRTCLGVTNCLNVLSNVPFAIVGLFGLIATSHARFLDPWERWPYATLFVGVVATAVGSSYYHLAPDNARLVWDRLPMTFGFMGLLTALVAERISLTAARRLLIPLATLGAASVGYWYWSELQGAGDLRAYVLVQFGSLLVVAVLLGVYPTRYSGAAFLWAGLIAYAAAKLFELADGPIMKIGHVVSGHTLKHLAAAGAAGCIAYMLRARRATASAGAVVRAGQSPLPDSYR
jgi:predicted membrane channel-forming protein YqfA (hemolysin III family)